MTQYRSLIGGFYSTPDRRDYPVSIRANNPGAVNGAAWERSEPGYVTEIKYDGKNNTTIFETPEHGTAVYYKLLQKYRSSGAKTVKDIIWKYGGGQDNYTAYAAQVAKWTGLGERQEIPLDDYSVLLPFAKAMFRYEAGRAIPWSDAQIIHGFNMARGISQSTPQPQKVDPPITLPESPSGGLLGLIWQLLKRLFTPAK
jgi:hypothetical protein